VFSLLIALFTLGGFALGTVRGESSVFAAEALIVLQDPDALQGGGPSNRFITEQIEILRSPIVADAAAAALAETPIDPPITSEELIVSTSIGSSPESSLVFLGAVDGDPDRAVAMVNALAVAYQDVSRIQATQSSDAALSRIDSQLESLDERFAEVARDIRAERDANVELSELERQADESLARIADLQERLANSNEETAPAIRQQIADYRNRIDTFRQAEAAVGAGAGMLALLEEQEQLIDRRTELLRNRDQIALDADLAPGVVSLVDTADEASEFVESDLRRVLAVAMVLGVLTAFGVSYLLELRRRSFDGRLEPEEVLGAPLLADIPLFSDEGLDTRLPTRDAPRSAAAEGFRFAAASIQDSMRSMGAKSVMMVGATLGHGKSTTVVNTTLANARRGHSVLLIDCDFGNQDVTRLLLGSESPPEKGIIDVIEAGAHLNEATSTVSLGSQEVTLDLLSRGGRSASAANILSTREAAVVFEAAAAKYDIVFVDAPPLLQVAYASTIARYVDALVVVVSHGSPMREIEELVKRLQLIGTPVLGYLYNRSPLRKEMTAVDGSMMDILGEGGDYFAKSDEQSWWQRIRA
jgi:Mrp family chromosome partitioning ATPase/uncharacterized protein involved in exopolysaccharide biosynthesis